jgi:UDP-N-acetylglucosamine 2-epimerase (non-hydrolysing)
LVSFYNKIPVFHVEAGLRSYDIYEPFPEEIMRQMTSRVTQLHFAPTNNNKRALLKEGIDEDKIYITGNTVTDALFCLSDDAVSGAKDFFKNNKVEFDKNLVLITVHRRENHGERLDSILSAIETLVTKYNDHIFVLPVHPNPNVKDKVEQRLSKYENVHLFKPLDYPYLVYLMKHAKLILTDSGGIQEEAPTFGCPTLVMRYETERWEGIEAGVSVLVGADYDKIVSQSSDILDETFESTRLKSQNPYGNGHCAEVIENIISNYFK